MVDVLKLRNSNKSGGIGMDDDFKRTVLFIVGIYIFINFALGKSEGGEEDSDGALLPFNIPVL